MTTRNAISISVSVCTCVLIACGATPGENVGRSNQAVTSGDIYNFGTLASPGSCLDADGAGTADGTQIQEWQCNGTAAQSFSPVFCLTGGTNCPRCPTSEIEPLPTGTRGRGAVSRGRLTPRGWPGETGSV